MKNEIAQAYQLLHALAARKGKYSTRHLMNLRECAESQAASVELDRKRLEDTMESARAAMQSGNEDELERSLLYAGIAVHNLAATFHNLVDELSELSRRRSERLVYLDETELVPILGNDAQQQNADFRFSLVGKMVETAGPTGLGFEDGWELELLGERELLGSDECVDEGVFCFAGAILLSFTGDDSREVLTFDNGCSLLVPLGRPTPYPESMMLHGPNGETVVWR